MPKVVSRSEVIGRLKSYISRKVLVEGEAHTTLEYVFLKQLAGAPDRITALLVSTIVEDVLRIALSRFLKEEIDRMFADNGVLATFYARTQMAFSLGIIDKAAKADIDAIREVRNAAAHGMLDFDFDEEPIANACRLIVAAKFVRSEESRKASDFSNLVPRQRYMNGCFYYFMALGNKQSRLPVSPTSWSLSDIYAPPLV